MISCVPDLSTTGLPMAKKTINAKEILTDIKGGMDDSALMQKYGLPEKNLQSVFKKLVDAGVLKQAELDVRASILIKSVEPADQIKEPEEQESHLEPSALVATQHDVTEGKDEKEDVKTAALVEVPHSGEPVEEIEDSEIGGKPQPGAIKALQGFMGRIYEAYSPALDKFKTMLRKPYVAAIAGAIVMAFIMVVFFGVQRHSDQSSQSKAENPKPINRETLKNSEADRPEKSSQKALDEDLVMEASMGSNRFVSQLVNNGANVNAMSEWGKTPLMSAAERGHVDTAKLLLHYGAKVNIRRPDGRTALIYAFSNGHLELARLLADSGAEFTPKDKEEALRRACESGKSGKIEVVKLFLGQGVDVNAVGKDGWTALLRASSGNIDIVKLLLKHGAYVNAVGGNPSTTTPLMRACLRGKNDIVRILVDHGADLNIKNSDGETALSIALSKGNVEIMEFLKAHGAKE